MRKLRSIVCYAIILNLVVGHNPIVWAGKGDSRTADAQSKSTATPVRSEIVFDVSGRPGEDDSDGEPDYTDSGDAGTGLVSGNNGAHGGHAQVNPNKHGQAAGDLFLTLSYQQAHQNGAWIGIEGYKVKPGERSQTPITEKLPLNSQTAVSALAIGGSGGRGGHGGRGQDAGDGPRGNDAYHIGNSPVSGTNGGPGGNGGNEGHSTSGGNAGEGGKILVRTTIFDQDLAMLLDRISVAGNKGGPKGKGKGVGNAGAGGMGGSSDYHTWQEYSHDEDVYTTVTTTETNSDGEVVGTSSEQVKTGTRQVYVTRSSTAPGGSPGANGSPGHYSTRPVYDGEDSKPGTYKYIVVDENGRETAYDGPYQLILQPGYMLKGDLNNNGFYEPGETVTVSGLKVTNSGLSPTPKYQKIIVYIADNGDWIRSKGIELEMPVVLQPGESYKFTDKSVAFYLEERPIVAPGLFTDNDTLAPNSRVTRVERQFGGFSSGSTTGLRIRYPVEITPLVGMASLAPGEASRALFKVKNVSEQTIGVIPDRKIRASHMQLRRNGGNTAEDQFFMLTDIDADFSQPGAGFAKALTGLKPNEEMVLEGIIGVRESAQYYTDVEVYPELHLESILNPGVENRIQYNPFTIRVSQTFKHTPEADVLMVVNHSLNDKVLDALRYSAKVKNLTMDIWDFSYYGFFNLHHDIAGWENFFSAYRNKTIVILGNEIQTPIGNERAQNVLSSDDIINAGRRYGIRFVIVDTSGDAKDTVARLTTPQSLEVEKLKPETVGMSHFDSVNLYVKELESEVKKFDEEIKGDEDQDLGVSNIQISTRRLWGEPKLEKLTARARALLVQARRHAPETSLFIDYEFTPEKLGGFLFKKWKVGQLRVRRSVDTSRASVIAIQTTEANIQKASFIMSDEFQAAFNIGLNLDTKLQLIDQILGGKFNKDVDVPSEYKGLKVLKPIEFADLLLRSVLLEIIHEQLQIRPLQFKTDVDKAALWNKLDVLSRVANFAYTQNELDPSTPEGKMWLQFIIDIKYFSQDIVSTGDRIYSILLGWAFGGANNYQVSKITDELADRLVKAVFHDGLIEDIQKSIKTAVADLVRKRKSKKIDRKNAEKMLGNGHSALSQSVVRNGQIAISDDQRVRGPKEQEMAITDARFRADRANAIQKAFVEQAATLRLEAQQCAKLLERHKTAAGQ